MPPRWLNIFTCSITQAEVRARPIVLRAPPRWIYVRAVFAIVAAPSAKFLLFDRPTLSHQRLRERDVLAFLKALRRHAREMCNFKLLEPHVQVVVH